MRTTLSDLLGGSAYCADESFVLFIAGLDEELAQDFDAGVVDVVNGRRDLRRYLRPGSNGCVVVIWVEVAFVEP